MPRVGCDHRTSASIPSTWSVAHRDDRLVDEMELAASCRVTEVALELDPLGDLGRASTPRRPRPSPGRPPWPGTSRCRRRGSTARPRWRRSWGRANARPMLADTRNSVSFDDERRPQAPAETVGELAGHVDRNRFSKHDDELVAADPGHEVVGADVGLKPPGDLDQEARRRGRGRGCR